MGLLGFWMATVWGCEKASVCGVLGRLVCMGCGKASVYGVVRRLVCGVVGRLARKIVGLWCVRFWEG